MQTVLNIVQKINLTLSDYVLIVLLIGTGLFFSIKTRFVQVRCFGEGMRRVFGKISLNGGRQESGLSSFQALATAVAAQVGTGNIIGASGAILIGGPGAIFWMWIIAFFGMATIYAEAVLAQETRVVEADGYVRGGPVYYIKKAFPNGFGKFLAGFFAVATILALGFMGSMVQANSISETASGAIGVPAWIIGLAVTVVAGLIFLGGIQRIAFVTEKIVPIMAVLYIVGGLVLLVMRGRYLPETIGMIFRYAFQPNAIIGGNLGFALKTAISQGVKRGLFSNEAGMGSTPQCACACQRGKAPRPGCRRDGRPVCRYVRRADDDGARRHLLPVCRRRRACERQRGRRDEGEHGADGLLDDRGAEGRFDLRRGLPVLLRVLDGPGMELFRQGQRGIPFRQKGHPGLFGHRAHLHLPWRVPVQRSCLGACRHVQPAHGHSERHRAGRAGAAGRARGEENEIKPLRN